MADKGEGPGGPGLPPCFGKKKILKKRRRKKSRQGKRYSQINFVSTLQLYFFSACSEKIRIRHFVLFLAHYATLASDSFTIATLAGKKRRENRASSLAQGLDPPLMSVVFSFATGVKVVVNENLDQILRGKKERRKKLKINFAILIDSYLPTQEHRRSLGDC